MSWLKVILFAVITGVYTVIINPSESTYSNVLKELDDSYSWSCETENQSLVRVDITDGNDVVLYATKTVQRKLFLQMKSEKQ